jgi:hypothetical protein
VQAKLGWPFELQEGFKSTCALAGSCRKSLPGAGDAQNSCMLLDGSFCNVMQHWPVTPLMFATAVVKPLQRSTFCATLQQGPLLQLPLLLWLMTWHPLAVVAVATPLPLACV